MIDCVLTSGMGHVSVFSLVNFWQEHIVLISSCNVITPKISAVWMSNRQKKKKKWRCSYFFTLSHVPRLITVGTCDSVQIYIWSLSPDCVIQGFMFVFFSYDLKRLTSCIECLVPLWMVPSSQGGLFGSEMILMSCSSLAATPLHATHRTMFLMWYEPITITGRNKKSTHSERKTWVAFRGSRQKTEMFTK